MPSKADEFVFSSYSSDFNRGEFGFSYQIRFSDNQTLDLTEKLRLPLSGLSQQKIPLPLLNSLLQSLHLMLGINYWKTYSPAKIVIKSVALTQKQAQFWNTVYRKGLGEFFYRNNLDFRQLVQFPFSQSSASQPISFPRQDRALVGIGGGKDSIVVAELLKKENYPLTAFIVETQKKHQLSRDVVYAMQIGSIQVQRVLDPHLFEINKQPGAYNGHIPISAIIAHIGLLAAVLYDYRFVIVGNEKSSNLGNLPWKGETINHQWSKSMEFERLFQAYTAQYITPDVTYFSLLRPWYDLKITQKFSQDEKYFSTFSSCNQNFKITKPSPIKPGSLWCGKCAKCAFMFVALAAFIPKKQVEDIFQANLLTDKKLRPIYQELLGVRGNKPFDCIGTPEETIVAFSEIAKKGEYAGSAIMDMVVREILSKAEDIEKRKMGIMGRYEDELIPEKFRALLI